MSAYEEIPRSAIQKYWEKKATENQRCPVCSSKIDTTISLEHDRECVQCGLRFWIDDRTDEGEPEYRIDMDTSPEGRVRKMFRRRAGVEAVKDALEEDNCPECHNG